MLLSIAGIVVGLAVLAFAADQFVLGAARIAARLRISTVVIGAVVVGFGTSAPEMVVSALAAGQGSLDIALGNIVGSNIANLSLVLGAATLVVPIVVGSPTIRREVPLSLAAAIALAVVMQGGVSAVEGVGLLIGLGVFLAWIILSSRGPDEELTAEVEDLLTGTPSPTLRESLRTFAGLVFTVGAAQVLVTSAVSIAERFGVEQGFVGLTLVAIGTSLPELATSLQAARRRDTDLIVGNLLGSNIFNSLGVAGIAGLFATPGQIPDPTLTGKAAVMMLVIAALAALAMASGRRVVRFEGAFLLIAWMITLPLLA
jgi:cation:H+ antiporter